MRCPGSHLTVAAALVLLCLTAANGLAANEPDEKRPQPAAAEQPEEQAEPESGEAAADEPESSAEEAAEGSDEEEPHGASDNAGEPNSHDGSDEAAEAGDDPANDDPANGSDEADPMGHDHVPDAHGEGDHGGAHHDPFDLSHQNASAEIESPAEFKSDLAIWTAVVFFCLLAVLYKFAWGPVMDGLERREQSIAAMIDEAKQGQEKVAQQIEEYEAKLAEAGEEAREIVAKARKDADAAGERLLVDARQAADRERERAMADIANAKNAALEEIADRSVDIAVQLAGRIVSRELNAQDHSQLVRESLEQFPSRN